MIYPMAFLEGIGNKSFIDSAFSNAEFGLNSDSEGVKFE